MNEEDGDFYGLVAGDRVCVHGEGFGVIIETHRGFKPSLDKLTVRLDIRECKCKCGHVHEINELTYPHPRNVSRSH